MLKDWQYDMIHMNWAEILTLRPDSFEHRWKTSCTYPLIGGREGGTEEEVEEAERRRRWTAAISSVLRLSTFCCCWLRSSSSLTLWTSFCMSLCNHDSQSVYTHMYTHQCQHVFCGFLRVARYRVSHLLLQGQVSPSHLLLSGGLQS